MNYLRPIFDEDRTYSVTATMVPDLYDQIAKITVTIDIKHLKRLKAIQHMKDIINQDEKIRKYKYKLLRNNWITYPLLNRRTVKSTTPIKRNKQRRRK